MSERPDSASQTPDDKQDQLDDHRVSHEGTHLTTDQGVKVDHTDDSLTAGERGPTLIEDFHFREKLTRFDHERIPERVVHARGAGAYGYFENYEPLTDITRADLFSEAGRRTPVFVRFSTVVGSRGSPDTVRDVRGFATKFYTREGNWDLVGNNIPVFFIQDGIKFPDLVHAVKPEPHNEIPQAATAHDNAWDFFSLQPETTHMLMWATSGRALPRSFRMMQGFGVHTFRFVNTEGRGTFVKFHWRPTLGTHSLVWDEVMKIGGADPDYNRRDLWDAIESGHYPEYELAVQLVPEEDEHAFDFDLLDATKLIPEEDVPLRPIGRMVLDRNPDNFFAEVEQAAFHVANVVPGIDFTNDPLMQARLFSYLDTQLIRLGGPNFAQLPVNRPIAEVHHNQRDGYGQHRIHQGTTNFFPNSQEDNWPRPASPQEGAFSHYTEKVDGRKIRKRSESFQDHYSQAELFWNSMADWEKQHIVSAFRFELGKVSDHAIRERMINNLNEVDHDLATAVAEGIGVQPPGQPQRQKHNRSSPALSEEGQPSSPLTRKVAVLAADGVESSSLEQVLNGLREEGVICEVLAPKDGILRSTNGAEVKVDRQLNTMSSVLYDAVLAAGGKESVETILTIGPAASYFIEAYKHAKPIGAIGAGVQLLADLQLPGATLASNSHDVVSEAGVVTTAAENGEVLNTFVDEFLDAITGHRHYNRPIEQVRA